MILTLRERRQFKGLTQEQLAKKTGLSQMSISLFEAGRVNMIPEVAIKLAGALDCSPAELIDSQVKTIKSAGRKVSPQIEVLLDLAKKACAIHPLGGVAVAREALKLHKSATKTEQGEPNRDSFGRKREPVKVERDQFGRVMKK